MKILILQDDFPPYHAGGAGVIAYELAKGLMQAGDEVWVITTVHDPKHAGIEEFEGIPIERIYSKYPERWRAYLSLFNPQVIPSIKRRVRKFRPDVVHVHNIHSYLSYHSIKIAADSHARVIFTAHDAMVYHYGKPLDTQKVRTIDLLNSYRIRYNPLRTIIIRTYLKYISQMIAVSTALQEALKNNGIKDVKVIHNGIDTSRWVCSKEAVQDFKAKFNIGEHCILFGARLSGLKGGEKAIETLAQVVQQVPDAQLLVLGRKDEYAERMLSKARENGLAEHIIFTDWIEGETLKAAYHSSAVVLVPSLYLDPFPTVVLEAMACKKPVVVTNLGGAHEAVTDTVTGYIVDPFNTTQISEKVIDLLINSDKRISFGEAGYIRVQQEFSLTGLVDAYRKVFETYP